ncbi:MAG: ABC transporter ATP-binding protein [Candidatus Limnocylindrales bacterium]
MTGSAPPLLEVTELVAGYGELRVLHGISLRVEPGEFVAVVGANGAGKSTLLRALMGLIPARGSIRFRGEDLLAQPAHRRAAHGIAYVPEGRRVFPSLTVEENLRVALRATDRPVPEALAEVYELFPRLAERRKQVGRTLSGGEQQMLAMGRALVLDPVLLIADEVSLGLAPVIVDRIFDVMTEMNRRGRAVLLAEQNVRVSLEAATRAYVLDTGMVGFEGAAADLRSDPRIVRAYLQEF